MRSVPPQTAGGPHGYPYSGVVVSGRTAYLAGQVGDDPATGTVRAGGFEAEVRQMFSNVEALLATVGAGLGDVIRATVYLTDFDDLDTYNAIFRECFPEDPPARTTVRVAGLVAPYRIEVDIIAGVTAHP